jgi:hypothetical protein
VLCKIAQFFQLPLTLSVVPENNDVPKLIAPLKAFASEEIQFRRASASPLSRTAQDYCGAEPDLRPRRVAPAALCSKD